MGVKNAGTGVTVLLSAGGAQARLVVGRPESCGDLAAADRVLHLCLAARRLGWGLRLAEPDAEPGPTLRLMGLGRVVAHRGPGGDPPQASMRGGSPNSAKRSG